MKNELVLPVVLAGGVGSRLWPLSRELHPKQFLPLTSGKSMLQETLLRANLVAGQAPLILCNDDHRFIVAEQLRAEGLLCGGVLLEPALKDTAPAIAMAALYSQQSGADPVLLVLAADHVIDDSQAFAAAVEKGLELAQQGKLATFGITPNTAETGYGYIKKGPEYSGDSYLIEQFVEKPDLETAEIYLQSGQYLWNSGMFMFKASQYLRELEIISPEIHQACTESAKKSQEDMDFIRFDCTEYIQSPSRSIDYAVMEKTNAGVVVPLDAGWNDVGSWTALCDINNKDENGNVLKGDVLNIGSHGCYVHAKERLVATIGLADMVVVDTKDAVLIASKSQVQKVKGVVQLLKQEGRQEAEVHREVNRPWGCYDLIGEGDRYQVKKITVASGAKLSLQKHHHRSEHWVVVSGAAKVTRGEEVFLVSENESVYIPVGEVHSLENPGVMELVLIEVQTGSYLGEDDIVRIEDRYGREETRENV